MAVFARNPASGALRFVEAVREGVDGVHGLAGARGVRISSDGSLAYATGRPLLLELHCHHVDPAQARGIGGFDVVSDEQGFLLAHPLGLCLAVPLAVQHAGGVRGLKARCAMFHRAALTDPSFGS